MYRRFFEDTPDRAPNPGGSATPSAAPSSTLKQTTPTTCSACDCPTTQAHPRIPGELIRLATAQTTSILGRIATLLRAWGYAEQIVTRIASLFWANYFVEYAQ